MTDVVPTPPSPSPDTLPAPQTESLSAVDRFRRGGVIPAHPLALTSSRRLDERHQRALTRYQLEAGASGLAVAVHSTQFSLHDTHRDLLEPVLSLAADTAHEYANQAPVLIAGVAGPTAQAVAEAELAASCGFDMVLLSQYGTDPGLSEDQLLDRVRAVAEVLPVVGFYLQTAVGGRPLSREFWRRLAQMPRVVGVKVAPFDRYATLDVIHAVARSGRADQVALYTGNDDHIIVDLVSRFPVTDQNGHIVPLTFAGGMLGQWGVWVRSAVDVFTLSRRARNGDDQALRQLVELNPALTDANGAIFDAAHGFAGSIAGIHEVLRRSGLLEGIWLLDEQEGLSPGQLEEIDRIWAAYPQLRDDLFVAEHRDRWLS